MASPLLSGIRQPSKRRHGLSKPAIARWTRNISGQHAQAHIEYHDEIATRDRGLIPFSSPLRSGDSQDEASQTEAGTTTSQGAAPSISCAPSTSIPDFSLGTILVGELQQCPLAPAAGQQREQAKRW